MFKKEFPELEVIRKEGELSAEEFWEAKGKGLLKSKDSLIVGNDLKDFSKTYLPLEILKTHLHIIGASGSGKSSCLELLMQDLSQLGKYGFCLIDPHGQLYHHTLNFFAHFPHLAKKVILFNPSEEGEFFVGFNPLKRTSYFPELTVQVKFMTSAVAKVWEEDSKKTPLLRRMMGNVLYPLVEGGYTFLEAGYFVKLTESGPRKKLLESTSNRRIREEWEDFESFAIPRKKDELGSLINRLPEFTDNTSIRLTLGRTENVLDFKDIFDNQKILLCNFSQRGRLTKDEAFMLGAFLINEMANYALSREEGEAKQNPFFLFVDEFQKFLTPDVAVILDECRKFGLHLILAHQHLSQLKKDPDIFSSVMSNARSKVIFGGLSWEDLEILEKEVFAGEHNLKEIKQEIHRTTVLDYQEDVKTIYSESSGEFSGEVTQAGEVFIPSDSVIPPDPVSTSQGSSRSGSKSKSESIAEVPVLTPILGKELASREFYSLEEQRYKNMAELKNQPKQQALVKILSSLAQRVKIRTVKDFPKDIEKLEEVKQISYQNQGQYYLPVQTIQEIIKNRQELLEAETKEPEDSRAINFSVKRRPRIKGKP